jgi:hypothetical protein
LCLCEILRETYSRKKRLISKFCYSCKILGDNIFEFCLRKRKET